MQNPNQNQTGADELRKRGDYEQAAVLYKQQHQANPSPYPLRWHIYCLRKLGRLEEANELAQDALAQYPQDRYIRSEAGWVIYDRDIKQAGEDGPLEALVSAVDRALEMDPENDLLTRVAVSRLMKTIKNASNPDWALMARYAMRINPQTLSTDKRTTLEGREFMSEREEWTINTSRAFLETEDYVRSAEIAESGLKDFPQSIFLLRNKALARFRSGDQAGGAESMRALLSHPRCDWYIQAELGEMEMALDNDQAAYRLLCQALLNKQDDQFKLGYFELFARLALKMGKADQADAHLALARAVRSEMEWSVPSSLTDLEEQVSGAFQASGQPRPELPENRAELARACRAIWKEGASQGLERLRGRIKQIVPDRKYTFIQPEAGGDDLIVFMRDLPRDCAEEGALVEYSMEKSYDRKKQRDAFKAVHVRKISE